MAGLARNRVDFPLLSPKWGKEVCACADSTLSWTFAVRWSVGVQLGVWVGLFAVWMLGAEACRAATSSVTEAGAPPSLNLNIAFDEANRLYEQNRFGAAADAYEQLLKSGQNTVSVHFNLGNARFRNGELGRAVLAYRQAQRLAPRDSDIQANLAAVRRAVGGAEAGQAGVAARVLGLFAPSEWFLIAGGAVGLFFTLLSLREWKPALRTSFSSLLAACVVIAALTGMGGWLTLRETRQEWGVITAREVTVRYTPLEESPVHFTALDGVELKILGSKTEPAGQVSWLEVQDWNGRSGWLKAAQIARVPR